MHPSLAVYRTLPDNFLPIGKERRANTDFCNTKTSDLEQASLSAQLLADREIDLLRPLEKLIQERESAKM